MKSSIVVQAHLRDEVISPQSAAIKETEATACTHRAAGFTLEERCLELLVSTEGLLHEGLEFRFVAETL